MAGSYKSIEMAREAQDKIAKRITAITVGDVLFDSNGFPYFLVGAGTDGAPGAFIRIRPIDWPLAKDVLNLSSPVYTPHAVQVVTEAAAAADLGLNDWSVLGPLLTEIYGLGARVEFYVTANGTGVNDIAAAPDTYIVAGNLKASVEHDLYKQMLASQ